MSQLHALAKAALLGTQRGPLPTMPADTHLGRLMIQLNDQNSEDKLLCLAGAISLHEQAGHLPPQLAGPGSVSGKPADDKPGCSIQAGRRLATMLAGRFQDLLPEFLTALAEAQQRVPDEYLPNLLERGEKLSSLRAHILPVLGRSGRWLAAQNPAWAYAAPEVDTWSGVKKLWRSSNAAARQTLLRQLRHIDPKVGRQLLETTWKAETPAMRGSFIKILEFGLTMDDEPFLEAALDDRSQVVRRKAADLLARLPESRLCRRMVANTGGLLKWTPDEKPKILVFFPRQISSQMTRDGVSMPNWKDSARVRSTQLADIVSAIPLNRWTSEWQASPGAIVQAALASRWPRTLTRGFALAAERQGNVAWAEALLIADGYGVNTLRLVPILPPDEFEALIRVLGQPAQPLNKDALLVKVLRKWPHPWSIDITRVWLTHVAEFIRQDQDSKTPDPTLRLTFKQFAKSCPLEMTDIVAETLWSSTDADSIWRIPVQDLISTLGFRRAMLDDIRQPDSKPATFRQVLRRAAV